MQSHTSMPSSFSRTIYYPLDRIPQRLRNRHQIQPDVTLSMTTPKRNSILASPYPPHAGITLTASGLLDLSIDRHCRTQCVGNSSASTGIAHTSAATIDSCCPCPSPTLCTTAHHAHGLSQLLSGASGDRRCMAVQAHFSVAGRKVDSILIFHRSPSSSLTFFSNQSEEKQVQSSHDVDRKPFR